MNNHAASVNSIKIYACLSIFCSYLLTTIAISDANAATPTERKPNVIIILADDLGYGNLSCYGAADIATPNIDRMAADGAKFNSFYVSPVCSPTRAALMTGSHSTRVGIGGVLFPRNNHGLKLSRKERNAIAKERSKAASQKSGPMAALYNLSNDVGERNNLLDKHPDIVVRLKKLLDEFGRELRVNSRPAAVASQP